MKKPKPTCTIILEPFHYRRWKRIAEEFQSEWGYSNPLDMDELFGDLQQVLPLNIKLIVKSRRNKTAK